MMRMEALKLSEGQAMTLDTTDDSKIVLPKASQPTKYTLDELLVQCDFSVPAPEDLRDWNNMKPVANEVW
jgi:antitoxin ChpS